MTNDGLNVKRSQSALIVAVWLSSKKI